ncbi:ankyrin repeat domain-containing protein [Brevibacillus sp. Leaf182]|uniref:ankyrin repeat domain-containing protein n=1 Tax=Brevibacillus sp. Leaf182 TaxID=1736290 RepID=UPI0006F3CB4E|nr:ankyrin repeat domain-containing protein [Brevibacillus sp. Leaf182]RAT97710.1 ankyrin repeat domain-containing protein [Brevibacillus sp. Leaf182]
MYKLILTAIPFGMLLTGCMDEPSTTAPAITTAQQQQQPATPQPPQQQSQPGKKPTLSQEEVKELNKKLLSAAAEGKTDEVKASLAAGAEINAQDDRGRTAAMAATHGNHVETVKVLIEAGADINIQDDRQDNPFLYAGAEGYLEILKLVIDAGPDTKIYNRFGGTPLIPAAEHGYVEVAKELLTRTDVDVNHVNNPGWTALMEAIVLNDGGKKQQEMIQLLIDHGADVNIPDSEGKTPLYRAKERGYHEIVQILQKAGAR